MQQVLLHFPLRTIADWLPELPIWLYIAAALLCYVVGYRFDQVQRAQTGQESWTVYRLLGSALGMLFLGAGLILFAASKTDEVPIYGYGMMLFVAFIFCIVLGMRLARREGVRGEILQDLALWVFVTGILGARVLYAIYERKRFPLPLEEPVEWLKQFFAIWDGGLVFYGSAIGAVIGYFIVYLAYLKKQHVSNWKMIDIIAPCVALGLCLGRIGCLLNGCCFGNVATCADCPSVSFPLAGQPRAALTERGYQTAAGFTFDRARGTVTAVESDSEARRAGLQPGDSIVKVNGQQVIHADRDIDFYFRGGWPRGRNVLELTVERNDAIHTIGPFEAWTMPLHPTQIYESVSTALLLFFLLSYYPYKKRDGSVMVFFMIGYGTHRFLNEMLRKDTDPVGFGMTLSQNISILVLLAAAVLAYFVWRRKSEPPPMPGGTMPRTPASLPATTASTQPI